MITSPRLFEKGAIVTRTGHGGYYRVTACQKDRVNLGHIFPSSRSKVIFKDVPVSEVSDADAAWHANWTQSETYQCM